uniref:IGFBP N-terminal domain-containing protein n=1 Tax=Sciurus vulgaris TaxID=55149 RepID=A0A8D2DSF8_SCIVU
MTPYRLLPPLLLLTLLLASRPTGALAQCPGCGQGMQEGCPGGCVQEDERPPAEDCEEAGGCLRREGQQCGVYTPNCVSGLQCQPHKDEEAPLRALLLGRGRCSPVRAATGESDPSSTRKREGNPRHPNSAHIVQ